MLEMLDSKNWLAHCNTNKKLTELLLPGTHDTMTAPCKTRYYRTQVLSLQAQLNVGVRYLDVRLRNDMHAAHRKWMSKVTAEEILDTCGTFLVKHPSEFILMRLQNANERKDDFEAYGISLKQVIANYRDLFYSWKGESTPWITIGEARGKIIALDCAPPAMRLNFYQGRPWAITWHENPTILLQDLWDGPTLEEKEQAIIHCVRQTSEVPLNILSLNHISATNGSLGYPDAFASRLNPDTLKLLRNLHKPRGVWIYDFLTSEICKSVLMKNFEEA